MPSFTEFGFFIASLIVREIATALNARGIATPRGGKWHSTSVHRMISRLKSEGSPIAPVA